MKTIIQIVKNNASPYQKKVLILIFVKKLLGPRDVMLKCFKKNVDGVMKLLNQEVGVLVKRKTKYY